jgi:hypothetical protein
MKSGTLRAEDKKVFDSDRGLVGLSSPPSCLPFKAVSKFIVPNFPYGLGRNYYAVRWRATSRMYAKGRICTRELVGNLLFSFT